MPVAVRRVTPDDADRVESVWQAASAARRAALGLPERASVGSAIQRPGAFGAGVFDGDELVALAVAMPALADDGRSQRNVPGLVHISSVAATPERWGEGLAGLVVRAAISLARRRGYARAQLWTHKTNARALRLYEREGFALSGREKIDDFGEPIVHLMRELPVAETSNRTAARLLCLDRDDRVLLMQWWDPLDGYVLWEPPGGGIEPGEDPAAAVLREWQEETGLPAPQIMAGPAQVARDQFWGGGRIVADEWFFLGRLQRADDPAPAGLTDKERTELVRAEWVALDRLDGLEDPVVPDLHPILARLRQDPASMGS